MTNGTVAVVSTVPKFLSAVKLSLARARKRREKVESQKSQNLNAHEATQAQHHAQTPSSKTEKHHHDDHPPFAQKKP
jgi:hypothetical protein